MASAAILLVFGGGFASAEPSHGIAMYGDPALPPDFVSLPYVNPEAPKGGRIVFGEGGGFDSLNPHILKGRAPYGVQSYVFETLMGRNWDEPFTLYGLLAESVETGPNRDWVEFTLRPEAKFSDGSAVTAEDVLWSYETLGTKGHPRYLGTWAKVAKAEITGARKIRFTFNVADRELALLMGMRPILKKAQWEGKDFAASTLDVPIGSAPYVISDFKVDRYVTLKRNPDYWGKDLPFMRGQANLDEIRYDFYSDGGVIFEAFKGGEITTYREGNAGKWDSAYDFPAIGSGDIVKSIIPHQRPSGISGLVMNTRRALFKDWRVREAMIQAFNFEFINQTLNGGTEPRITSYFSNSVLGMDHGPAEGREAELLAPFYADIPPGAIEGYALPVSDGTERNRANIGRAMNLMAEAGWTVQEGVMRDANGTAFSFEILLAQGSSEQQSIADIYASALKRLGITVNINVIDPAQFKERTNAYDFDMTNYTRSMSLSPGNEQMLYWGKDGVTEPGTRNWMGMDNPAVEAMVTAMLTSDTREDFIAATKALDRVLTSGRYVIPTWYSAFSRIAHARQLKYPSRIAMYGDWIGFQPDVWWYEE
ncbi:extracellular solute-binding protein [Pseudogemmobacter sp. W21_MBD1_M6]|uniref:extracellular solute-binding protein n=1 Tax=Pseudogemmobacter sp. W21_MBD1_M6 TaxID=3240271 RepID=UPI003F99341D